MVCEPGWSSFGVVMALLVLHHVVVGTANGKASCPARKPIPPLPRGPTDNNGIRWPDYCFAGAEDEHAFILGDWGGLSKPSTTDSSGVRPADNTHDHGNRGFAAGIDSRAQRLVANEMSKRAARVNPRYVLNAGDNYYWGGIREICSSRPFGELGDTNQWFPIFEDMYKGRGMDGKPWFSTLGNHDYGGFRFKHAWDQQIAYTYVVPNTRWVLPAQYWHQHVEYPTKNFSVDYYMVDTQTFDAKHPYHDPLHNICSLGFNGQKASCAPHGPRDPWDCQSWFKSLWKEQLVWLDRKLNESTADWQIIVTHFPPEGRWGMREWRALADMYGIDLFISAHRHQQEVHEWGDAHMPYVVSGGGGGVTSERNPAGSPDQYGFMDLQLTKHSATIKAFNQDGVLRRSMTIHPREGWWQLQKRGELNETLAKALELSIDARYAAAGENDDLPYGGRIYKHPEAESCDGMGELVANNSCNAGFQGAQVTGVIQLDALDVDDFIEDISVAVTLQEIIAKLAKIGEPRDVTVVLTQFVNTGLFGRRLAVGSIDARYSIEVPMEEMVEEVGRVLNSRSLQEVNAEIKHMHMLRRYGVKCQGLSVDGLPAPKSREVESAELTDRMFRQRLLHDMAILFTAVGMALITIGVVMASPFMVKRCRISRLGFSAKSRYEEQNAEDDEEHHLVSKEHKARTTAK